jgi:hypothetical protein
VAYNQTNEEMTTSPRGNKAKNDKDSILVEAKKLVKILHYQLPSISAIQRREGAWYEMKRSALNIIRLFVKARVNKESRITYIDEMLGEAAVIVAMFDECIQLGVLTDKEKLEIASCLDRIDADVMKWRSTTERRSHGYASQDTGRSTLEE